MEEKTFVRVLGSADWQPTAGNDHSCYTLSDRILIDACPSVVVSLLSKGVDPINCDTICFTHMHADHYMGLAPLLLYWRVRKGSFADLTITGPAATIRAAYERAVQYVFHDSRDFTAEVKAPPMILELDDGDTFETDFFTGRVVNSDHAVPGVCYRLTSKATGRSVGFSGDTRYRAEYGDFFAGVDMLVHEASFSTKPLDDFNEVCRHSSVREAIAVAEESKAKFLLLTHTYWPMHEAAVEYARKNTFIPSAWAIPGEVFGV